MGEGTLPCRTGATSGNQIVLLSIVDSMSPKLSNKNHSAYSGHASTTFEQLPNFRFRRRFAADGKYISGAALGEDSPAFVWMSDLVKGPVASLLFSLEYSQMRRQNPFGSILTAIFVIILACASIVTGIELGTFLRVIGR